MDLDFEKILEAAKLGQQWAFEKLYLQLSPAVVGYLRLQGSLDPEASTSDVFLGVFKGIKSFSGNESQFRSWVFTIAHHKLIDERRKPKLIEVGIDYEIINNKSFEKTSEDIAIENIGNKDLQKICQDLYPDQRDVILLRLLGGFTIEETAKTLNKTPGAVKSLQHRAIKALKKKILRNAISL